MGHETKNHIDLNVLKGALIFIVILDHNEYVRNHFEYIFRPLNYHVLGFLFLPFLANSTRTDWPFYRDRLIRYLIPFAAFYTAASAINLLILSGGPDGSSIVETYLLGGITGSAANVKASSGFYAFWFLPALCGTILVLSLYRALPKGIRPLVFAIFIGLHLFVGLLPNEISRMIPLGLPIVAYLFVLGSMARFLIDQLPPRHFGLARWASLGLFVLSYAICVSLNSHTEVGTLSVGSILDPEFLLHDLLGLSGFFTFYLFSGILAKVPLVEQLGRLSLIVYLAHPLLIKALDMALLSRLSVGEAGSLLHIAVAVGSVAFTVATSFVVALVIQKSNWLHDLITPRDWASWLPVQWTQPATGR
ncbi:acyltransferase family protein [Magnetospira sp. QH-2]|uniref:acyltransferase family protein n=1 Tax=Magnetospira sp. (strain QH-2) TaxID=1288970 RepID=UPI0003E819CE|nr:acyltransferase family protein [Magnetospira sp. QH-2]CCQ72898.1 conserved membrane protein of unknown function [Magnetospira sp. QH-2]